MNESHANFENFKAATNEKLLVEVGTVYSSENTRKVQAVIAREAKIHGYAKAALSCRCTSKGWTVC